MTRSRGLVVAGIESHSGGQKGLFVAFARGALRQEAVVEGRAVDVVVSSEDERRGVRAFGDEDLSGFGGCVEAQGGWVLRADMAVEEGGAGGPEIRPGDETGCCVGLVVEELVRINGGKLSASRKRISSKKLRRIARALY
jgi:hypothetical protein